MQSKRHLTSTDLQKMAPELTLDFAELHQYHMLVAGDVSKLLAKKPEAFVMWKFFKTIIDRHAYSIRIGTSSLQKYPSVRADLQVRGFGGFWNWFSERSTANDQYWQDILEQAILISMAYLVAPDAFANNQLTAKKMAQVREAFNNSPVDTKNFWVARIKSKLIIGLMEVYILECYFPDSTVLVA
ncbi:hypothetical protein KAZ57_02000 [Patescibacteria group bacterium]|nr:hypothetical protein [Patescibacteria group bacterium]